MRAERNRVEEARHQAVLDSMARAEKQMADSLEALERHLLDSLTQAQGTVLNPSKLGGLYTTKLESKYYIVVGAFRTRSNAENKLKSCNAAGYTATIVSFRNGLLAVAICPSGSLDETLRKLKELRGTEVCPQDGWILINS
ncbi:MAG: SPOR domain-containing protein [Bacteroidales bacterium]|nr:SPOR domain-containing protein [Bacteroidales bacterium]MBQ9702724.1 SPOR domain-containing protein [Bacteroidales bacterium]MBR1783263.1 SPOR domain-containing protein [Bacteroidales bacterium]